MPAFCNSCGSPVPPGAAFCGACGRAVAAQGSNPAGSAAPGAPLSSGTYPGPQGPALGGPPGFRTWPLNIPRDTEAERRADRAALSNIRVASVLALVGAIAGIVSASLVNLSRLVSVAPGTGALTIKEGDLWVLWAVLAVTVVFVVVELLFLRFGFRTLADVDPTFSTPAKLAILALVAFPLVGGGVALIIEAWVEAVSCAGAATPIPANCLFTSTLSASIALILIGGLIALIGYIGVILGVWRLGNRFNNGLFKAGAILILFPYVSLVGQILILVAATQELGRVAPARVPG